MKVLCLFPRFYIGGVSKALGFVANCCAAEGWDVYCVSMTSEPETIQLNKKVSRITIDIRENSRGIRKLFWRAVFMFRLRLKIRAIRPDVIVVFRGDLLKAILYATAGMRIPVIGSERGNPLSHGAKLEEYRRYFGRCAAVVFQTEMAREVYGLHVKSVVIPNPGISRTEKYSTIRSHEGRNIVSAGRLSKEKNFAGLIDAFAMSKGRLVGRKLIIYGDGPERDNLEEQIDRLGLKRRVVLAGNVKDFTSEVDDSGIFVLNSLHEGMPNALIEAMVAGYACVATDCPAGAPQWLSDGGRRIRLVPVSDDKALGEALVDVAADERLATTLRNNAKEIVEIIDPKRIGRMWTELIKEIARGKSN